MKIPEKYYNTVESSILDEKDSSQVKDWIGGIITFCLGIALFWIIEKHLLFLSKYGGIL